MAKIRVKGDTSGYIDIAAPDVAGAATVNLDKIPQTDQAAAFTSNITTTGNVGIGTASPSDMLTVDNGTSHASATIKGGSSSSNYTGGSLLLANPDMDTNYGGTYLYHHKAGGSGNQNAAFNISQRTAAGAYVSNIWNVDYQNNAHSFYIPNGGQSGSAVLVIDGSGRVTMPYQPAFEASMTSGTVNYSGGTVLPFNAVGLNRGNHFNTSTYSFTAPVSGLYYFEAVFYAKTNRLAALIQVNSSAISVGGDLNGYAYSNSATSDRTISASLLYQLSANDVVNTAARAGYSAEFYGGHSTFSGYLIG